MRKLSTALLPLCCAALFPACNRHPASTPATAPQPSSQMFVVKGVIKELEPDGKTAIIRHEAISNYMPAMTMPFEVNDTHLLRGLQPGDEVQFHLVVTPAAGWIDSLYRLNSSSSPKTAEDKKTAPPGFHAIRALPPLEEGDLLPDYHLTNELGQPVSLGQFKGRVLALTFFFTSCPYPDFCPRMTANFAQAAQALETMTNAPAHCRLLSISFDPANDTPAILKEYAQSCHYDPARWSFLTGSLADITGLADRCGEHFQITGETISHDFRTVVVDPSGRVRKIIPGNSWTSDDLIREILSAAR